MGVYTLSCKKGDVKTILAHNVIIATGGIGDLYQYTTNPPSATGDGISMAYRTGADIINAEFIQFHPTSLFHKDIKRFYIIFLKTTLSLLRDSFSMVFIHYGRERNTTISTGRNSFIQGIYSNNISYSLKKY